MKLFVLTPLASLPRHIELGALSDYGNINFEVVDMICDYQAHDNEVFAIVCSWNIIKFDAV